MKKVLLAVSIAIILIGLVFFIEGAQGRKKYLSSLGTLDFSFSFNTSQTDFTKIRLSDVTFLSFENYLDDSFQYYDYVAEKRAGFVLILFGGMFLVLGLFICSVSEKIDWLERSIRKKVEELKANVSDHVVNRTEIHKTTDDSKYTWRCSKCGKINRIGTEFCVACENPYYNSLRPSSPYNSGQIPSRTNDENIRLAYRLLGNGSFDDAESIFDTVLVTKPDDPQACFGKLMCQHRTKTISVIKNLSIDNDALYQKVKPVATEEFFDQIRKLMN